MTKIETLILLAGGAALAFAIYTLAKKQEAAAPSSALPQPPAPGFNPTV